MSRYGRFAGDPSPTQLARCFHLDDVDRALIDQRRRGHNRLGFAVQLTTVRFLGTFLHTAEVPRIVVDYVARQLSVRPSLIAHYAARPITQHEHADLVREAYGYEGFSAQPAHFRLVRWLFVRSWVSSERPSLLFDAATSWLVERKILLPGVTTLSRLIARVRDRAAARAFRIMATAPSRTQREQLEALLVVPDGARHSGVGVATEQDSALRAQLRREQLLIEARIRISEASKIAMTGFGQYPNRKPG